MNHDELLFQPISVLSKMLRDKKVRSLDLTVLSLQRLHLIGKACNAVAQITEDIAIEQAERADKEISDGHFRSALHGIPFGAKDLLSVKGVPTRWGSSAHKDQQFNYSATVIDRLEKAGAVLTAKLAMVELAGGGGYSTAGASITGPCLNPWDKTRWAGGSSSGSGSAVGSGIVGFAIGTETWGSITVPAAFCGISGLRPTYGRVNRYGAMALSWTMDKIGTMARYAEDCGTVLSIIAGSDKNDVSASNELFKFNPKSRKLPKRIGILATDFDKNKAPEAKAAFESIISILKKQQFEFKDVKWPDYPFGECANLIITAEASASFSNVIRGEQLAKLADEGQQGGLIAGIGISAADYIRAMQIRQQACAALAKMFDSVDVMIAPTLLKGAPLVGKSLDEQWEGFGGNGGPPNLAGIPSLSIPMGFTSNHMPLGLEIIAPAYEESSCLALGMAIQRETDWHKQFPKV